MTNKQKRIVAFILMIVTLICIAILSLPFYQTLMMCFGGWQVGRWAGDWGRAAWPDPVPQPTPSDDDNTFEG